MSEAYQKSLLDRFADALIKAVALLMDKVKPGWSVRNKARLDEWKLMLYALNRNPIGLAGLVLGLGFVIVGIVGPIVAPHSYDFSFIMATGNFKKYYLAPPGTDGALLGTDDLGRDLLSQLLYGARISLIVTALVLPVGISIGIILGLIAGYFGGAVDETIMRITDIFLSFPMLILALALTSALTGRIAGVLASNPYIAGFMSWLFAVKPSDVLNLAPTLAIVVALWIAWWPPYARVVRGLTLQAKNNVYVEAARAMGMSARDIMFKHILPNIIGPIIVLMTLDVGNVIMVEAGLSYIMGAQIKLPDWGAIVQHGSQFLVNGAWWLVMLPGLAILISVLGWNLFGDALRDILDPRTRRSIEFRVKKGGGR